MEDKAEWIVSASAKIVGDEIREKSMIVNLNLPMKISPHLV